jgi:hypothetical protein
VEAVSMLVVRSVHSAAGVPIRITGRKRNTNNITLYHRI